MVFHMSLSDQYFFFSFITILITRVVVYVFRNPCPTIKNFRTHHWMFGLIFMIVLFCISNFYTNIYMISISTGIFLDEIGFILIHGKTHEDNYSPKSFMILLLFLLCFFLFREAIINFYF